MATAYSTAGPRGSSGPIANKRFSFPRVGNWIQPNWITCFSLKSSDRLFSSGLPPFFRNSSRVWSYKQNESKTYSSIAISYRISVRTKQWKTYASRVHVCRETPHAFVGIAAKPNMDVTQNRAGWYNRSVNRISNDGKD